MHDIHHDDRLRVAYTPGTTDKLVVAFTGVGYGLGAVQAADFTRTLRSADAANHVVHVFDLRRSWYNDCLDEAQEALHRVLRDVAPAEVYTLGNSMGGFGALLFSGLIPRCVRAISFSPQTSICPDVVPWEWRYGQYREAITAWRVPDVLPYLGRSEAVAFFGSEDAEDVAHAERLRAAAPDRLHIHVEPGSDHNVAAALRDRGELVGLLSALLERDADVPALMAGLAMREAVHQTM